LSIIYAQSATYYDDVIAEQDMWSTLTLLEHAPGPIDGAIYLGTPLPGDRYRIIVTKFTE